MEGAEWVAQGHGRAEDFVHQDGAAQIGAVCEKALSSHGPGARHSPPLGLLGLTAALLLFTDNPLAVAGFRRRPGVEVHAFFAG